MLCKFYGAIFFLWSPPLAAYCTSHTPDILFACVFLFYEAQETPGPEEIIGEQAKQWQRKTRNIKFLFSFLPPNEPVSLHIARPTRRFNCVRLGPPTCACSSSGTKHRREKNCKNKIHYKNRKEKKLWIYLKLFIFRRRVFRFSFLSQELRKAIDDRAPQAMESSEYRLSEKKKSFRKYVTCTNSGIRKTLFMMKRKK